MLYLLVLLANAGTVHAQDGARNWLHFSGGYGAATRYGNNGYLAGFGYTRMLPKIDLSLTGTWFSLGSRLRTAQMEQVVQNPSAHYASWFITPAIGYHIIGNAHSPVLLRLVTGLGFRLYNYALPVNAVVKPGTGAGNTGKYQLVSSSDRAF